MTDPAPWPTPPQSPYAAPPASPHGAPPAGPYAAPPASPYTGSAQGPYAGAPQQSPYPAPSSHPYGPPTGPRYDLPTPQGYQPLPSYGPPAAYPPAYPPVWPPAKPDPMPAHPVEYQHLLAGPRRAWWKPLVTLLLGVVGWIAVSAALTVGVLVVAAVLGEDGQALLTNQTAPIGFGVGNLILAALIPAAGLATWAVHRIRPGFLSSVTGRLRWGWLLTCMLALVPLWVGYLAIMLALDGQFPPTPDPAAQAGALIVLALLTTPLQAAGEEYFFRGLVIQQVGAWVRNRWIALLIAAVLSGLTFALAHGSLDPWILLDLVVFATVATLLTWRTGGLEAAIAIHVVHNVMTLLIGIIFGGFEESFINTETTGSPLSTGVSAAVTITAGLVLWGLSRWRGVARLSSPRGMLAQPA